MRPGASWGRWEARGIVAGAVIALCAVLASCAVPVGPDAVETPIGGTYAVTLEPVEGGQGVVFRGVGQVRQRGGAISGQLTLVGGCIPAREAPADARSTADCVLPLTGSASARERDTWALRAGAFPMVLRLQATGDLEGLWTGATGTGVVQGRTRWTPLR